MQEEGIAKIGSKNYSHRLLRQLPGVDTLLNGPGGSELIERYGHELSVTAVRFVLEETRKTIFDGATQVPDATDILAEADLQIKGLIAPTLRPVINATGVIIHTNLGRAPMSSAAIASVRAAASGYSSLEYDLESGQRGSRSIHAEKLLIQLTGSEAALVVNNNAAAVLLMLTALCQGKEVIISRGQLVEIGGGFRVPDVMAQSGARLVEVGTTNRTHLLDYAKAVTEETAAILVAHHSNFKIIGFTSEPTLDELAQLAKEKKLLLLYDQGSGALANTSPYGLDHEPTVQEGISAGVDIVCFSGDKLLGGPQAGILCGREELIATLKKHPLARALRTDKMCLAALSATLARFLTDRVELEIPVWQMISRPLDEIEIQAGEWATFLQVRGFVVNVVAGHSMVGGGSLPGTTLPTRLLAISHPSVDQFAAALRKQDPPVIGRIAEDRLLLDPRTVLPGQEQALLGAIIACG